MQITEVTDKRYILSHCLKFTCGYKDTYEYNTKYFNIICNVWQGSFDISCKTSLDLKNVKMKMPFRVEKVDYFLFSSQQLCKEDSRHWIIFLLR